MMTKHERILVVVNSSVADRGWRGAFNQLLAVG